MKPLLVVLALLLSLSHLSAQQILLAEYRGRALPVVQARRGTALVRDGGKLVPTDGSEFAFREGGEFLPFLVNVSDLEASTHALQFIQGGGPINNEFGLYAIFSSLYEIPDAYLVLQLQLEGGFHSIFVHEIGDLHPGHPVQLRIAVPLSHPLGSGHYVVHLYSGGLELLHTGQSPAFRERALDHFVAKHSAGLPDGPPKLLVGPAPEYPPSLRKNHPAGEAVVRCNVRRNGTVADTAVISATDPAFGDAAVAAVKQWRFMPRIKAGQPANAMVDVPLTFAADQKT